MIETKTEETEGECTKMKKVKKALSSICRHGSLTEVMNDHELASLGDAFVNFTYSLALSIRKGVPSGTKVKGALLAEALRKAGLRECISSRMTSHKLADAAEALIVYAWLHDYITLGDIVRTLESRSSAVESLTRVLGTIRDSIRFS